MFLAHLSKAAIAGLAATTMATSGAVAWTVTQHGDKADMVVRTADDAVAQSLGLVPGDGTAAAGAGASGGGTQASGDAKVSGSETSAGVSAAKGATAARATAGATTSGSFSAGGSVGGGAGGAGGSVRTDANGGPVSTGSTGGSVPPASGAGSGSNGGGSGGSGGSGGGPTVPSVPSGVSLHREGSYTLVVAGTPSVDKKLCLSGEVDRCRNLSVPALQGVTLTVSYSGNASASAPSFDVFRCQGGLGVTVSGITPGTDVTVKARGVTVSRTLSSREVSQSASLCDA